MEVKFRSKGRRIAAGLALATLVPALAMAAEVNRITVEDPATSAVKFKVTSEGNVTGGSLTVTDSAGASKFVVQSDGSVGIGLPSATYPLTIDSGIATAVPAGVGMAVLSGSSNKERMEIRSFGPVWSVPALQGKGAQWVNGVPAATLLDQYLIALGGSGHDGSQIVVGNRGMLAVKSGENWTPIAQGTYITMETTPSGATAKSEKVRITGSGNVGIGTTAPGQKLEVNGGVRINTATGKPSCDSTTRGTFWVTQGGSGVKDSVDACLKDAGGVYAWRMIW